MSPTRTRVDVAAGVLIRPDGHVLLASRPVGKPYAGYWEFPGGKVEPGESIAGALARELHEELSIDIETPASWLTRVHDYPHALVQLHFLRVFSWRGVLRARERQQFGFFTPDSLPTGPLLPATVPVLRWVGLPPVYGISAIGALGPELFLRRLEAALERGLMLLQFREPALDAESVASIFPRILERVRAAGATMLVNSRHDQSFWDRADGVHLTAADAAQMPGRPEYRWVAASAHSTAEVQRAVALGVDCLVVGPVRPTTSHPAQRALGWSAFATLITQCSVPAYALGGMHWLDLRRAVRAGAHGIASLSGIWGDHQEFGGAGGRFDSTSLLSEMASSAEAIE